MNANDIQSIEAKYDATLTKWSKSKAGAYRIRLHDELKAIEAQLRQLDPTNSRVQTWSSKR